MRWQVHEPPRVGDIRAIKRFAWWFVLTDDGHRVLWERYVEVQVYRIAHVDDDDCRYYDWLPLERWTPEAWAKRERKEA